MNRYYVPALSKYDRHLETIGKSPFSEIQEKGYKIFQDVLLPQECDNLSTETILLYNDILKEHGESNLQSIAELGCVRGPFISSRRYRDLMLNELVHKVCRIFFPCNYMLHLNRSVVTSYSKNGDVGPSEIHRDLPYMFAPAITPLSLSFLFIFSNSNTEQLGILPDTHYSEFYNLGIPIKPLDLKKGSLLVFNSNLLHCSLPTTDTCTYTLFMYTSPLIKPVVNYKSKESMRKITSLKYRIDEILVLLGHKYDPPDDDNAFLRTKYSRIKQNEQFYIPTKDSSIS